MVIWLIIKIRVHSLPNAAYCLWYIYIFIAFLHIFIAYCSAKNGICDMYRFYRNIFIYSYCFHRTIIALHNILWKSFNYALTIKNVPTLIWKWYYRCLHNLPHKLSWCRILCQNNVIFNCLCNRGRRRGRLFEK